MGSCAISAACCVCCCGVSLGIVALVGEIIMLPISGPLYCVRRFKVSRWIEEWKSKQSAEDIKKLETWLDGSISYSSFNKITPSAAQVVGAVSRISFEERNDPIVLDPRLKQVPKYLIDPLHRICTSLPNKRNFMSDLNILLRKIKQQDEQKDEQKDARIGINAPHIRNLIAENEGTCCICFGELTPQDFITECVHMFHEECILEYKRSGGTTCPKCREPLIEK